MVKIIHKVKTTTVRSSVGSKSNPIRQRLPDLNGLSKTDIFEKYNFLGYDNGDGEISCSRANYDGIQVFSKELPFLNGVHIPNILAFEEDTARLVDEKYLLNISVKVYSNFKCCPGVGTNDHYNQDNTERTYGDLMGHSFACAVKELLDKNAELFESGHNPNGKKLKQTFILVGRPSSKGWEAAEQEYEAILTKYLPHYLPDHADRITVMVLSESLAAMADTHFLIEKTSDGMRTVTDIIKMDDNDSVHEIARLLGSDSITEAAISNASEMKKMAKETKHN